MGNVRLPSHPSIEKTSTEDEETEGGAQQNDPASGTSDDQTMSGYKDANVRAMTAGPRPSLRKIFTTSRDHRIDGKARPSTAVNSSLEPSAPPPLDRSDTVPVLRSVQILNNIPRDNQHPDEQPSSKDYHDNPYLTDKDIVEITESEDSDIDITDILENSTRSAALSTRTQSSKSRDSGICRGDSFPTKHTLNKQIV
ncbi:hypothetical protein COOONC_22696 [Cooperia oncophora]